jgi:hypothetical protein
MKRYYKQFKITFQCTKPFRIKIIISLLKRKDLVEANTLLRNSKALNATNLKCILIIVVNKATQICPTKHAGEKRERIYSFQSFLTSALDRVSGERHAPAVLKNH